MDECEYVDAGDVGDLMAAMHVFSNNRTWFAIQRGQDGDWSPDSITAEELQSFNEDVARVAAVLDTIISEAITRYRAGDEPVS